MSEAILKLRVSKRYLAKYYSVSRLKLFDKCPLAFKGRYDDHAEPTGEKNDGAKFGTMLHGCHQNVYNWVIDQEHVGLVPDDVVLGAFKKAFRDSEVTDVGQYKSGLASVRGYYKRHKVDHRRVLGIEKEFWIELGDFDPPLKVMGYMDLVERVDHESIIIVDYKSNKRLFTRDEMRDDLQMDVYGIAGKRIWPWAKKIYFGYEMLRYDTRQFTERTDEDLLQAEEYVIGLVERIEALEFFVPKLNFLCPWCDYRDLCPEYLAALKKGEQTLSYMVAADDIEKICREYDRASALESVAKRRKKDMQELLLAHFGQPDAPASVILDGKKYHSVQSSDTVYDYDKVIDALSRGLRLPRSFVAERVSEIAKGKMDKLISGARLSKGAVRLLKEDIRAVSKSYPKSPFISSRATREKPKKVTP